MRNSLRALRLSLFTLIGLAAMSCGPSSGKNPTIKSLVGPAVSVQDGKVQLSMTFKGISTKEASSIAIPDYPNSGIDLTKSESPEGISLVFKMDVKDFLALQGAGLPLKSLPGGRLIPGVPAGTLPALAVSLSDLGEARVYLDKDAIGIFVPFQKLGVSGLLRTYRFFDAAKKPVGMIATVTPDSTGANQGVLVLMDPSLLGIKGEAARRARLKAYYQLGLRL